MLRYLRRLFPDDAVAWCQTSVGFRRDEVDICRCSAADGKVHTYYRGLSSCKRVWVCPVCTRRMSTHRARELDDAVRAAVSQGLQVVMVTLTFSHHAGQGLADNLQKFYAAQQRMRSGRKWTNFRRAYGPIGYVRAQETTYSRVNGWHPHGHELWFLPAGVSCESFAEAYRELWQSSADAEGLAMSERGFRWSNAGGRIADYIAKYGHEPVRWSAGREVARGSAKLGYREHVTPFQLLALAASGDVECEALFVEYGAAYRGRRQLYWSRDLRSLLGLAAEVSDEEAAEPVDGDGVAPAVAAVEVVTTLSRQEWYWVYRVDAEYEVLVLARYAGAEEIHRYVADLEARFVPRRLVA